MIPLFHVALVLFLVVVFPLWDRRETARLKADPTSAARVRSYRTTIAWLWLATGLLLVTVPWTTLSTPPALPGLPSSENAWPLLGALSVGLLLPVVLAWLSPGLLDKQLQQFGALDYFLPQSDTERWWFVGVSLSAGFCEEVIFRGFLIAYLISAPWSITPWAAVVLAAAVFGIDHGYQGWKGIGVTAVMALLFTGVYVVTGSLWAAVAVHTTIDLRVLVLLWLSRRRQLPPPAPVAS